MVQNGAQTSPMTIFSPFSRLLANSGQPGIAFPCFCQHTTSPPSTVNSSPELEPGPCPQCKTCEIWPKMSKYGVWEGFLAIWGHFQVIWEKKIFRFFDPPTPKIDPLATGHHGRWRPYRAASSHQFCPERNKSTTDCALWWFGMGLQLMGPVWKQWHMVFTYLGMQFPFWRKQPNKVQKNRPFTCKIGIKQVYISPNTVNWAKTKGFNARGTNWDDY